MSITKLTNPVARQLRSTTHGKVPIIATMQPGDVLEFRIKGTRTRYPLPMHQAYQLAIYYKLVEQYRTDLERYELRRKAGYRARKPKAPNLSHFSAHLRRILGSASPLRS